MKLAQSLITLAVLVTYYLCVTSAWKHGKGWEKHGSKSKKEGARHGEYEEGDKYQGKEWDQHGDDGVAKQYGKSGQVSDSYGKHHGGRQDNGKYNSGINDKKSWGGHDESGGKTGQHKLDDKGQKKEGFKNTYQKSETGESTTYHEEVKDGNVKNDFNGGERTKKYGGVKFYKGQDGNDRFEEAVRGDNYKDYGTSGRDNHQGGKYNQGGDRHHKKWDDNQRGGRNYGGYEGQGTGGHESGSGGYGGYGGHKHGGYHH